MYAIIDSTVNQETVFVFFDTRTSRFLIVNNTPLKVVYPLLLVGYATGLIFYDMRMLSLILTAKPDNSKAVIEHEIISVRQK